MEELLNSNKVVIPIDDQERTFLLESDVPSIIFTGDGMMESPRARWYYDILSQSAKHAVILTGHTARGSFARQLLDKETYQPDAVCSTYAIKFIKDCPM